MIKSFFSSGITFEVYKFEYISSEMWIKQK